MGQRHVDEFGCCLVRFLCREAWQLLVYSCYRVDWLDLCQIELDYQLHRGKQAFLRAGRLTCWVCWRDLWYTSVMFWGSFNHLFTPVSCPRMYSLNLRMESVKWIYVLIMKNGSSYWSIKMLISMWLCSGCAAVAVLCFACGCVDVAVLICWSFADMLELWPMCQHLLMMSRLNACYV